MNKLIAVLALALFVAGPVHQASAGYLNGYPCATQLGNVSGSDARVHVSVYTEPDCSGSYIGWADLYESSSSEARLLETWRMIGTAIAHALRVQITTSGTTILHITVRSS